MNDFAVFIVSVLKVTLIENWEKQWIITEIAPISESEKRIKKVPAR